MPIAHADKYIFNNTSREIFATNFNFAKLNVTSQGI